MSHSHGVYDTDLHFIINPITRQITNESLKTKLVQYDHNSERFTFELPRIVEGHDMSMCSKVEIHYINVAASKAEQHEDVYEVDDVAISPTSSDTVEFSWLISGNATQYAGTLNFLVCFTCLTGEEVDYAWHTEIYSGITVANGMNNGEAVVAEYSDVLEAWKREVLAEVEAEKNAVFTEIEAKGAEVLESIPDDYTEMGAQVDRLENAVGKPVTLSSSDFVNGAFTAGTGITDSAYWITTHTLIPVKVGDPISIKLNGFKCWWRILNTDDLAVATNLKHSTVISVDTDYTSEYDGYFMVQIGKTDGGYITPEEYVCEIVIGKSRIDKHEKEIAEINNELSEIDDKFHILSASPKHKPFTKIVNDCQTASDWTITNTDSTLGSVDTENFITGSQSLRSDNAMRCVKHTYNLLENDLVIKFRINSIASGAQLLLRVANTSASRPGAYYTIARGSAWTTPTDWQEVCIPYTTYSYTHSTGGAPDFSAINDLHFYVSGAVDWNIQYIGLRPKTLNNGIVTFTFDDGYTSQFTGIKILAEKGITGTIFHIKEATDNASTQVLTIEELQNLVNHYGADIEVHGDPSYDQWDETELVAHWTESKNWLKENGLGDGKYMAYPNGIYPDNVVQLARAYFDSCRTITRWMPVESFPVADRYRVRAVSGVGGNGDMTVTKIQEYIDKAVAGGGWLILVFHKIGDGTDSMWCSESDLKAIADYAIASGANIMNYAEAFESVYAHRV